MICFGSLLFIYFIVPETKGKTLEEIQQVIQPKARLIVNENS